MPGVHGLHVYLGKSPAAKHASLGKNLYIQDEGFLCQQFRRSLLESQGASKQFRSRVDIPELPPVDVRWTWVGQTAGVALWERVGRVEAASILLNGIECDQEAQGAREVLAGHTMSVPMHVWETLAKERKPVILTMYFDLFSFSDPVIATAAPALANSMFTLFGTSG